MRKYLKKQAGAFLDTLQKVHGELKNLLNTKEPDTETILTLLADCQQGAIELGNMAETSDGDGAAKTVAHLEAYCEQLFEIHEKVSAGESVNGKQTERALDRTVTAVRKSVEEDLRTTKEVVFLPYKASMWDSLESVFKSADEDPDCDAYVVPIPYFDRNAEGEATTMHYEIDLYPKDVPVVRYDEYDFKGRHPDVIFIHNPYDGNNYVTSVHPAFYSDVLKQYTEKLVYIPYFVLGEIDPDNKEAVEAHEHYITVPGVINADETIVQDENWARVYVNVLTKYFGKETRKGWEKKIKGLGSPKIDKALSIRREDCEIPPEWEVVLKKEDGSFRKVIFYNTSVAALLAHDDKMLDKMVRVFEIFKENKEEVALLWRPHPLIHTTLESMRPQLIKAYDEIVAKYRAEGWGIYDDTPDMDRAIALADAYFGDPSSLVTLCKERGMPVMIQNVEV